MDYKAIGSCGLSIFEKNVNNHIKEGWELQGGMAISEDEDYISFYQAMIKK